MIKFLKSKILRVLRQKEIALFLLCRVMKAHNKLYHLAGFFAIALNDGQHPKHRILRYKEWFVDRINHDWVVVDVGSNTGSMAALIAAKAKHVYGIEIIPELCDIAREKYHEENLDFITADATTFDYSNCLPIDCITLSNVLEHIPNRVEFLAMLRKNVAWSDSSSRTFLIRVPTIEREWLAVYKKELSVEYRLDLTHEIEHTRLQFFSEMTEAGLTIEKFDVHFGEFYAVCRGTTN